MRSRILSYLATTGRVLAHLQGFDPCDVWPSYRTFEDDTSTLVDVLEALGDSAKPFLEMRERAREKEARETEQAVSNRRLVLRGPVEVGLDDAASEEIERNRRVVLLEGVNHLGDEE